MNYIQQSLRWGIVAILAATQKPLTVHQTQTPCRVEVLKLNPNGDK